MLCNIKYDQVYHFGWDVAILFLTKHVDNLRKKNILKSKILKVISSFRKPVSFCVTGMI